jgi:hypothetical protein
MRVLRIAIMTALMQSGLVAWAQDISFATASAAARAPQLIQRSPATLDGPALKSDGIDRRAITALPSLPPIQEEKVFNRDSAKIDTTTRGFKLNLQDGGRPSLQYRLSDNGVLKFRGSRKSLRIIATWQF